MSGLYSKGTDAQTGTSSFTKALYNFKCESLYKGKNISLLNFEAKVYQASDGKST